MPLQECNFQPSFPRFSPFQVTFNIWLLPHFRTRDTTGVGYIQPREFPVILQNPLQHSHPGLGSAVDLWRSQAFSLSSRSPCRFRCEQIQNWAVGQRSLSFRSCNPERSGPGAVLNWVENNSGSEQAGKGAVGQESRKRGWADTCSEQVARSWTLSQRTRRPQRLKILGWTAGDGLRLPPYLSASASAAHSPGGNKECLEGRKGRVDQKLAKAKRRKEGCAEACSRFKAFYQQPGPWPLGSGSDRGGARKLRTRSAEHRALGGELGGGQQESSAAAAGAQRSCRAGGKGVKAREQSELPAGSLQPPATEIRFNIAHQLPQQFPGEEKCPGRGGRRLWGGREGRSPAPALIPPNKSRSNRLVIIPRGLGKLKGAPFSWF